MKLHRFCAKKNGRLYRAFTRDKSGKILSSKKITVGKNTDKEVDLLKKDWAYLGEYRLDFNRNNHLVQHIRNDINSKNVSVFEISTTSSIFVFDIPYDGFNARLYSMDEDLSQFIDRQNDIELMPQGEQLGHGKPKCVGKIDNKYFDDLIAMDIDVFDIMDRGFYLKIVGKVSKKESLRRFLERNLKKEFEGKTLEGTGAHIMGINVHDVRCQTEKPPTINTESENRAPQKSIEEKNLENHTNRSIISITNSPNTSIELQPKNNPRSGSRIVSFTVVSIGVIGSIITIYLFLSQYILK